MTTIDEKLEELMNSIKAIEGKIESIQYPALEEWIPKKRVMDFLSYGETAFSKLLKEGQLRHAKIGRRTFISKKSLIEFLEDNTVH